ncbi:hypothetical protein ACFW3Z_00185 [Nocardiopsis alba]|uniref:hypothetical protein n=1 Tax=Nocardiopsis alba TaxID=53437 RepID=UPI0033F901FB
MIPQARNTAGTRAIPDVIRDPRQWWWGIQGGNLEAAAQDLRDLRAGLPLRAVAHLEAEHRYRQGLLIMRFGAAEPLTWRRYRPFRSYAEPIPIPSPIEILGIRAPRLLRPREYGLAGSCILDIRSGALKWRLAVVAIDVPVVIAALTEAESWAPGASTETPDPRV